MPVTLTPETPGHGAAAMNRDGQRRLLAVNVSVLGLEQQSRARLDRCGARVLLVRDRILRWPLRAGGMVMELRRKISPAIRRVTFAAMILIVVSAGARAQNLPPPGSYQPIPTSRASERDCSSARQSMSDFRALSR